VALQVVPQSSRKRRDKLLKTLSRVTQRATGETFAKQVASTAKESRTKFQLSLTAVGTVSYEFCPLHGMLNDAMFHTTHLSRRHRKHQETSCVKDYTE